MIQRALLSVSDKTGIVEFARALSSRGVELLSTGGTAKLLTQHGVAVTEVSDYTGFPEMMDGRVKTLHPKIHGGLLGRRGQDEATMDAHGIGPIDLVAVNLYPFVQTIKQPDCELETAIENIDIGGPTMLRSAAKNYVSVTVVVSPDDYTRVIEELTQHQGRVSDPLRFELAVKAFEHTAGYDGAIANYLGAINPEGPSARFPHTFNFQVKKSLDLRYGENPHQAAAFYVDRDQLEGSISTSYQVQGKALSFNNIADTDAAVECVKCFSEPACVIVKHANPCGVAVAETLLTAYNHAYATDATSAFGGIIAFNRPLDKSTAIAIIERQFVEVIIAPAIDEEAKTVLARKPNVRVLTCGAFGTAVPGWDFKKVTGGLLVQDRDLALITEKQLRTVTQRAPAAAELRDLLFVWKVAKFVKSNAIVYGKNNVTIGIGAGQMSRVYSAKIAAIKAADSGLQVAGSVMASDAFFPFRDGIDAAAEVGITAVIQPGGSMRDQEVIAAANEHGMAMVFTDMRHFRH